VINPNTTYRVTGRYINEKNKVIAYRLSGEDGSQVKESRERVILLVGKGLIINMKTQINPDGGVLLRGRGINLNKVPICTDDEDDSLKYRISRRILYQSICVGYEIKDTEDRVYRLSRNDVLDLAVRRLVSNVEVNKFKDSNTGNIELVLKGKGININELSYLTVDDNGVIVDPNIEINITIRSAKMRGNGFIKDNITQEVITFKAGDFIVCNATGDIEIMTRDKIESKYTTDKDSRSAIGDSYLDDDRYTLEIYGKRSVNIDHNLISNWAILRNRE